MEPLTLCFAGLVVQSFLLGTWCVSALLDLLLAHSVSFLFGDKVEELPAGL